MTGGVISMVLLETSGDAD